MDPAEAAGNALKFVLEAVPGESILIVADEEKAEVAEAFSSASISLGLWTRLFTLEPPQGYRKAVPPHLRELVVANRPDIYMNLLRGPAEEVGFRIELIRLETRRRVRLAHCPGVTLDMLANGALALAERDYSEMKQLAQELLAMLQDAVEVRVVSPGGADFTLSVEGREFFTDVELDWRSLKWINLPVGEVMVAPVESSMSGKLVAEAAGGVGPVEGGITIQVSRGRADVENLECSPEAKEVIQRVLKADVQASLLGEFAIGVNRKARVVEEFLESEKVYGTVHVAFGSNRDFPGGRNTSKSHIDFLILKPTVTVKYRDGSTREILAEGEFKL
ncbi:MAG: hypothetical protein DRN99_03150 [Thermoproteota archaeon]|nr:MAG: hypothetical protein DRN99_03150 [Candidatus Korarchaeota archaeon]